MYEVVRPLVNLLKLECTLLQNFESLMALTNLAGISERLRLATRGKHLTRNKYAQAIESLKCMEPVYVYIQIKCFWCLKKKKKRTRLCIFLKPDIILVVLFFFFIVLLSDGDSFLLLLIFTFILFFKLSCSFVFLF